MTPHPRHRVPLTKGPHRTRADGLCAMELVAWLAGEPHSDSPMCACPVLAALTRALNDRLPDSERDGWLRPLAPRLVGTRGDRATREIRALLIADRVARQFAPSRLAAAGHVEVAHELRTLPELDDLDRVRDAAARLAPWRSVARAAAWTLERAASGAPPAAWVPGAVHAAEAADGARAALALLADAIEGSPAPV